MINRLKEMDKMLVVLLCFKGTVLSWLQFWEAHYLF